MRLSIRMKIFLGFSILVLASSVAIACLILKITTAELEKRTLNEEMYQAKMSVSNIDNFLGQIKSISAGFTTDKKIMEEIQSSSGTGGSYANTINKMRTTLSVYRNNYSVYVYDIRHNTFISSYYGDTTNNVDPDWLTAEQNSSDFYLMTDKNLGDPESKQRVLVYSGPMKANFVGETIAYVSVSESVYYAEQSLCPELESKKSRQYILNENNKVVLGDKASAETAGYLLNLSGSGCKRCRLDTTDYLMVYSESKEYHWKYVRMIPVKEVYQGITVMIEILSAITVALLLVCLGLSYVLARGFTKPIYDLRAMMARYRSNSPDYPLAQISRQDEFGELYDSYNEMIKRTDYLIDEVYRARLYKKDMEIKLIQSAINPHFIYNVLDSINWILKMGEYRKAEEVLPVFSKYLRNMLSFHRDTIVVRELKLQLENYCELRKFFSDDRIHYSICFDEELMECSVMTLLLQPVLENTYEHGFGETRKSGTVTVTGRRCGGDALFTVEDDGSGIAQARLEALREAVSSSDNVGSEEFFGLNSVSQRLRLAYGEGYGIEIESKEGKGTRVNIKAKIL